MKLYELTYLISQKLSEKEAEKISENINSFIQKENGILIEDKKPSRQILSYPIDKSIQAYLVYISFYLDPEKIINLEKELQSGGQIIRHLLLSKKLLKKTKTSPFLERRTKKIEVHKEEKVDLSEIEKKLEEILEET